MCGVIVLTTVLSIIIGIFTDLKMIVYVPLFTSALMFVIMLYYKTEMRRLADILWNKIETDDIMDLKNFFYENSGIFIPLMIYPCGNIFRGECGSEAVFLNYCIGITFLSSIYYRLPIPVIYCVIIYALSNFYFRFPQTFYSEIPHDNVLRCHLNYSRYLKKNSKGWSVGIDWFDKPSAGVFYEEIIKAIMEPLQTEEKDLKGENGDANTN